MAFVSLAVGAGVGLLNTGIGIVNNNKAKDVAKELEANRPKLTESPFLNDQYALAQSELARNGNGAGDVAYNQMQDRATSSSIGAILRGGGSVNNVQDVFDSSDQGRQRYAMMRENIRMNNINNYNKVSGLKDVERGQIFDFNINQPWKDKAAANGVARQGAQQQINSGINTAASAFMGIGKEIGARGSNATNSFDTISGNAPTARNASTIPMANSGYDVGSAFPLPGQAPAMQMDYTNFNIPAYTLNGMNYNLNEIPQ